MDTIRLHTKSSILLQLVHSLLLMLHLESGHLLLGKRKLVTLSIITLLPDLQVSL